MLIKTNESNNASNGNPNNGTKVLPHKRGGGSEARRLNFHSKTCASSTVEGLTFGKLDLSIPEQKRRLEQRRKMISYGKNTAGYEEYLKQVPKEKRRIRCMETPMTPDHTLDIPNKRWAGQVRAWRIALHKYDPPDLQASLASVADPREGNSNGPEPDDVTMTVQDRELADAKNRGLLVDIGDTDTSFPTSMLEFDCTRQKEMEEIDNWDIARGEEFRLDTDDDSDDDLL